MPETTQNKHLTILSEINPNLLSKSAVAVGFFDGVHLGHQKVITKAVEEAKRLNATPCVVTFAQHPRLISGQQAPKLLTDLENRLKEISNLGIQAILLLPLREDVCKLSPREYVQKVLLGCLNAASVSIGFNHHFAHNRQGNPQVLAQLGDELNFAVHIIEPVCLSLEEISSSTIRSLLETGKIEKVNLYLGRTYSLSGSVIHGDTRGRELGFPTANISTEGNTILPKTGVYACFAETEAGNKSPCVVNIGSRPTVTDSNKIVIEAHLLDFSGDLYGQKIKLEFIKNLRAERKFACIEDLVKQISEDTNNAREILSKVNAY